MYVFLHCVSLLIPVIWYQYFSSTPNLWSSEMCRSMIAVISVLRPFLTLFFYCLTWLLSLPCSVFYHCSSRQWYIPIQWKLIVACDLIKTLSIYSAEDDTYDVYHEVVGLAGRWSSMCLALRLLPSDQSEIAAAHPGNPHDCLQAVIVKWLQKCYNYQRFGSPTWKVLVKAVGDPAGGNNSALAEIIANKHPGRFCCLYVVLLPGCFCLQFLTTCSMQNEWKGPVFSYCVDLWQSWCYRS